MNEKRNDDLENNDTPLPIEADNTLQKICSFSAANVNKIDAVEAVEDIDKNPAPLPDYIKNNNNKEAALPPKASELKNVLDKSRKTFSEMQKQLINQLHNDDAKILQVDDDNDNSASVYLQFDEKCFDKAKINNAIKEAIECAKKNKQNFEIKSAYLPYIKSIFVDRKSVKQYGQGGGDDEVLLNGGFNNRELKSLKFYQKHNDHPGEGKYNMIMVAEYKENNKNDNIKQDRKQYCIIDMDNNLMISNDSLKLYCHGMDGFENHGFDDKKYKVYETGLQWCAFRINNRLRNDNFTEAKKFILTNGDKLYGVETLEGVTQDAIERECNYIMEGMDPEDNNKLFKWATALIHKISAISDSINDATTIQQLYEIFLQGIQKDLLKANVKQNDTNNNFLYLNGKDIVDYFCKNPAENKTINKIDLDTYISTSDRKQKIKRNNFNNNTSIDEFKQKILNEIFQNNKGGMAEIDFVKAFLEKATQHIVDAINNKMKKLHKKTTTEVYNKNEDLYTPSGSGKELQQCQETYESETPTCKCGCNTETCLSLFDYVKSLFTSNKSNNI